MVPKKANVASLIQLDKPDHLPLGQIGGSRLHRTLPTLTCDLPHLHVKILAHP